MGDRESPIREEASDSLAKQLPGQRFDLKCATRIELAEIANGAVRIREEPDSAPVSSGS